MLLGQQPNGVFKQQPCKSGPLAAVTLSEQHPNSVSLHVRGCSVVIGIIVVSTSPETLVLGNVNSSVAVNKSIGYTCEIVETWENIRF